MSSLVIAFGCGGGDKPYPDTGPGDIPIYQDAGGTDRLDPGGIDAPIETWTDTGFEGVQDAGEETDQSGPDVPPDGIVTDEGPDDCPGGLGCPCDDNGDCYSGFCVETMYGGQCSSPCFDDESCPPGWICTLIATHPDSLYICVDPTARLCQPCTDNSDCLYDWLTGKSLCVEFGPDGAFCGVNCEENQDCPKGFTCVEVTDGRDTIPQCLPSDGVCPCTEKYELQGNETYCWIENEFGICHGKRTCDEECGAQVPAPESCNLKDDDCDGATDEGVESSECPLTNEYGTCMGQTLCVAGEDVCEGLFPSVEICNGKDDDCDGDTDEGSSDIDEDGIADCVDCDADGDGIANEALGCEVPNPADNCPLHNNPGQEDNDSDDIGDACDPDDDNDGIPDLVDNCPFVLSLNLQDTDVDGEGDVCDCDIDGDGVANINPGCPEPAPADNCPYLPNPGQEDANANGIGDVCDGDMDGDGILNPLDNCPSVPNPDQDDNDGDAVGDLCDTDDDNDGVPDDDDNCQFIVNPGQEDVDDDGMGDVCDGDMDGDGIANEVDNCPGTYNPGQEDVNDNGVGDACESDWDGDGISNGDDNCVWVSNPNQADMDTDGQGDACDCDIDGDGLFNENPDCDEPDPADNCPDVPNADQEDMDGDDIGDPCDMDIDGDLDPNDSDCGPEDPTIFHGQDEACNGVDDNCDGDTDEKDAIDCLSFYKDMDKDGYGTSQSQCLCSGIGDYTALQSGDCDDDDDQVNPGVAEKCSGMDDDCDGHTDEEDAVGCTPYYRDVDGDTWGLTQDKRCLCSPEFPYTTTQFGDCDDTDASAYPGAIEKCNQRDDNCDGQVDEENAFGCTTFYLDSDDDGFGLATNPKCLCMGVAPYDAFTAGDCDDTDAEVNPSAEEKCNDKDDDCNGTTDEDNAIGCTIYYLDADRDGFGVPGSSLCKCGPEAPYDSTDSGDCNDVNDDVFPGAVESCNGIDDDCDGSTDEEDSQGCSLYYADADGDGFGLDDDSKCLCSASGKYTAPIAGDCNDLNKTIYPEATEACNGKDDDCDGTTDEVGAVGCLTFYLDADDDSYGLTAVNECLCGPQGQFTAIAGGDCDDGDATVNPGALESCTGVDDDCDGQTDEEGASGCASYYFDGDGDAFGISQAKCLCEPDTPYIATVAGDCNDNDASVNPGGVEACNGKDDDCDGAIDEEAALDCATYFHDNDADGFGLTGNTKCLCFATGKYTAGVGGDCNDDNAMVHPGGAEKCNDMDDDCDGSTDEEGADGCAIWYLDNDVDGFGATGQWKCLCESAGLYTSGIGGDCNDNDSTVFPGSIEICPNGQDDDCDGETDEAGCQGCFDFFRDVDDDTYGVTGNTRCLSAPEGHYTATIGGDCKDNDAGVNPGADEACNGKDDDCDGETDEEDALNCSDYYYDNDTDGFGDPDDSKCLCSANGKYTTGVGGDCDDDDLLIYPGAVESCNGVDDDCDGETDEENASGCAMYYLDSDGDTFGNTSQIKCLCAMEGSYTATVGGDCDDDSPAVFPGAVETCLNNIDDDCDGSTDEENCQGCTTYYLDVDDDTWGVSDNTRCLSSPLGSHTASKGGDCNDIDPAINPDADESCNSKDDDCDGDTDEEDALGCNTFFLDGDTDNHGDPDDSRCLCSASGMYSSGTGDDCNDADGNIHPGATEYCNGVDDDCDSATDEENATGCATWYLDSDGDTYGVTGQTRCLCSPDGSYSASQGGDCEDGDGAIYPGAVEVCANGKDDDCDDETDEAGCQGCTTYYLDSDDDTWGVSGQTQCLSSPGAGGYPDHTATIGGDCDDNEPAVNPGAIEACNGINDDCDGATDEEDATGCDTYYMDNDTDSYGVNQDTKCLCAATGKYTAGVGGDCDDADSSVNPGAVEACNGKDDDCDNDTDEADATGCSTFYFDNDVDLFGLSADSECLCVATGKYTAGTGGDCDDDDDSVNPGADEVCLNAKDDDCDGETDEPGCQGCTTYYLDVDDDTWGVTGDTSCLSSPAGDYTATRGGDCNDADGDVNPDADESCNSIDDDCDGFTDEEDALGCDDYYFDNDDDNFGLTSNSKCLCSAVGMYTTGVGGDCDDADYTVNPSAIEACNGKDDDCDDETDESGAAGCTTWYFDGDGDDYGLNGDTQCLCAASGDYSTTDGGDCDDDDGMVNPGANEACNSVDDDCDGSTDEEDASGCSTFYYDLDNDSYGVTGNTKCLCAMSGLYRATVGGDCDDGDGNANPGADEVCNDSDDDCDGSTDEEGADGCSTYYYDNDSDTYGTGQSKCLCSASGKYTAGSSGDCDDNNGGIHPGALEVCNLVDDDCDGSTDEENAQGCSTKYFDGDTDGYGVNGNSKCLCDDDGFYTAGTGGDCADGDSSVNPGATEACNGKDDDCDSMTDEEDASGCSTWYYDYDADNFGTGQSKCLCAQSGYYRATVSGDCLDSNAAVHPGATEICNGMDDDCNGSTDEEDASGCSTYYYDNDADSFGISSNKCLCSPSGKYSANTAGDCNDNDGYVYPGATEACNGKDDDCDSATDEEGAQGCSTLYYDGDSDGYGISGNTRCLCSGSGYYTAAQGGDCADGDSSVNPGATEACNGKDDDCDSYTDEEGASGCSVYYYDNDGDGYGTSQWKCMCSTSGKYTALSSGDCCDSDPSARPGQSTYFTSTNGCGTWDYDCNSSADKHWTDVASCGGWPLCDGPDGWQGGLAECGQYTWWQTDCYIDWFVCATDAYARTQECR